MLARSSPTQPSRTPPAPSLPPPLSHARLDAYYELGLGGCWDLCAAVLVLEEAGGRVLDPSGAPFNIMSRRVLGTNAHLAEELVGVLKGCPDAPGEPPAVPPPA